MAVQMNL
jgi:hypothetical protein